MENINKEKDILRQNIASIKKLYTSDELNNMSSSIFSKLQKTDIFINAKKIFIYHSLRGEVQTMEFISEWILKKEFFLPAVTGKNLTFRKYDKNSFLKTGKLGVMETDGADYTAYNVVDLIIVPGIAFDLQMNRLGRGKGYYDRFLPKLPAVKIGVCFDFQLFEQIPSCLHDVKMDYIITEDKFITPAS